jgi:hypothetical protein
MKFHQVLFYLLAFVTTIRALAVPASFGTIAETSKELFKRKGGGGGGGKGGGGGSSSSSSGSGGSSGGRGSGSSSSTGSSSSRTPASYGGGQYYGGGARTPVSPGGRTAGGLAPYGILGVGALAFFPGLWLYGAYAYAYPHPYTYHNNTSNQNETRPVQCLCEQYNPCGKDDMNVAER